MYVVDLNSSLGTFLNGSAVTGVAVLLHSGDTLTFGKTLAYFLEIESLSTSVTDETDQPTLILSPTNEKLGLEPLAIERFPFLVGKHQPALTTWIEQQPEALSFLSRRHMLISHDGTAFIVEDLSSTNGTWINGVRERGGTRPLAAGDTIAFGQEGLSFQVTIKPPNDSSALAEGTILISSAESFLDIYCQTDSVSSAATSATFPDQDKASNKKRAPWEDAVRKSRWSRWSVKQRLVAGCFVLVLVAAGGSWITQDNQPEQIRALLASNQPGVALELATAYLENHPDDFDIKRVLAEAARDVTVPKWLAAYSAQNWTLASELLEQASIVASEDSPESWVEKLSWITRAASFQERTHNLQRVRLYLDDRSLTELLADPAQPSSPASPQLRELLTAHPDLEDVHRRALSEVRQMKNFAQTYLPAMDELRQEVRETLDANELSKLATTLDTYAERYQRIDGITQLISELARYRRFSKAIHDGDLAAFSELEPNLDLVTPPFQRVAQQRLASLGDARRDAQLWRDALQAWAAGELDAALAGLDALSTATWQLQVSAQKRRWQSQRDEYTAVDLSRDKDTEENAQRLSRLISRLDAGRDRWLHAQVIDLLQAKEIDGQVLARQHLSDAWRAWQKFRAEGGIGSNLRLEPETSPAFRSLAELLKEARQNVRQAEALGYFLDSDRAAEAIGLKGDVTAEIVRQRHALEGLSSVLGQSVVQAKLSLIPVLETH